jgi:hypothetical protein
MAVLEVLGAIALIVAAAIYARVERGWRWRWREVEHRDLPIRYQRAPPLVRATAFGCLFFGSCLFAACLEIVFLLPPAIAPFLVAGFKLCSAGFLLLRREPREAYFGVRNAAVWALCVNGLLLVLGVVLPLTSALHDSELDYYDILGTDPPDGPNWTIITITTTFSTVAMAHALIVLCAVARWRGALFAQSYGPQAAG